MAGCAAERTAPRDWGSAWMILVGMWNPLSSILDMSVVWAKQRLLDWSGHRIERLRVIPCFVAVASSSVNDDNDEKDDDKMKKDKLSRQRCCFCKMRDTREISEEA